MFFASLVQMYRKDSDDVARASAEARGNRRLLRLILRKIHSPHFKALLRVVLHKACTTAITIAIRAARISFEPFGAHSRPSRHSEQVSARSARIHLYTLKHDVNDKK